MMFSQDGVRTAGDWSPPACSAQYLRFRTMSVMRMLSDLYSLFRSGGWNSFAAVNVRKPCAVFGLLLNRCFRVREHSVSAEASAVEMITKKATSATWDSLPNDLQENVLQNVDFRDLFRLKTLSNSWKKFIEGEAFRQSRGGISEGVFTAINYYIKNKSWRCTGHDLHSKSWRSSPPVSYLPPPDAELFKDYSVCGHGGLMCAEVSKLSTKRELAVINPLTGETRVLPPLLNPRNPVLVLISLESAEKSYKVIVAGSSAASDEHLSRKVEVFDSSTSKWKEMCDLPGSAFGLNEHQAGVCLNGKLFLISFLENGGRAVVAFDLEEEKWLQSLTTPIPWSSYSNILQLVESDGKLFLFSEQESDQSVDHCIDELEFRNPKAGLLTCRWRSFVKVKESGGRGLQVYPEHTCIGFGEENLGIFNPLSQKLLNILLASCIASCMPNGACAGDQSMDSRSGLWVPSNAWESPDFAKKAAVTLMFGLTMIGARVAWGIFRRRRAPGNRFDIMQGLEDSDIPRRGNPLFALLPDLP